MGKTYNKLDEFFGGWLPGGVPRGGGGEDGDKVGGGTPQDNEEQVATTASLKPSTLMC